MNDDINKFLTSNITDRSGASGTILTGSSSLELIYTYQYTIEYPMLLVRSPKYEFEPIKNVYMLISAG